jgi:hypothetical protein
MEALDAAVLPALAVSIVVFIAVVWIWWFGGKGSRALDFRDHDDERDGR